MLRRYVGTHASTLRQTTTITTTAPAAHDLCPSWGGQLPLHKYKGPGRHKGLFNAPINLAPEGFFTAPIKFAHEGFFNAPNYVESPSLTGFFNARCNRGSTSPTGNSLVHQLASLQMGFFSAPTNPQSISFTKDCLMHQPHNIAQEGLFNAPTNCESTSFTGIL